MRAERRARLPESSNGGFASGLDESNFAWVAWGAFGSGIPFGLLGLCGAFVLIRARPQAGLGAGISASA